MKWILYLSRARNHIALCHTSTHTYTHSMDPGVEYRYIGMLTVCCACNIVSCWASQLPFYTSHVIESVGRLVARSLGRFLFYTFAHLQHSTECVVACVIFSFCPVLFACVLYLWFVHLISLECMVCVCVYDFISIAPIPNESARARHFSRPVNLYLSFTLASSSGWTDERDVSGRAHAMQSICSIIRHI